MKRTTILITLLALLVGVLAVPSVAEDIFIQDSAGVVQSDGGKHCDGHAELDGLGLKINKGEIRTITVKDQNDVEHEIQVTNAGAVVSITLLTPGFELVSASICLKGGPGDPTVNTSAPAGADGVVTLTHTVDGKQHDISYSLVYSIVVREQPSNGAWCSPGYWRQPHHLGSWELTGYQTTDLFSAKLGYTPPRTNQGVRQGAPTNPTLLQVLQSPQWYGGDAFNAVGDLLSRAHPDVNFRGTRVEDSCPLGRAE
jgi:hypothetical protein